MEQFAPDFLFCFDSEQVEEDSEHKHCECMLARGNDKAVAFQCHRPRYNVLLKSHCSYIYSKCTGGHDMTTQLSAVRPQARSKLVCFMHLCASNVFADRLCVTHVTSHKEGLNSVCRLSFVRCISGVPATQSREPRFDVAARGCVSP